MLPIPAIDIQSGKCVRLQKGDLSSTKIYFEKPIDAASHWIKEGTKKLHLVDLDGAKSGKPENLECVLEIKEKFPDVNLQLGGGIRDLETLDLILESGVDNVILGSIAIKDKELFFNNTIPKLVFDKKSYLLYMSRAPIPANKKYDFQQGWRQVCAYSFPKKDLISFAKQSKKTKFEFYEDIEILRFLELGHKVKMIKMSNKSLSVDTQNDLDKAEIYLKLKKL